MKNILIVDDSPTVRKSAEFALQETGCKFVEAGNGREALDKVKEINEKGEELAICIVDINMPEMDGITFIEELRKTDKFTPIIVLSTESEREKIDQGKTAGAAGWIIKPFRPDQFLNIVKKFIK